MKIALIHLSDIHFRSDLDIAYKRRSQLANVISFSTSPDEKIFFVVAGDIAYSGLPEEYAVASAFFQYLLKATGSPSNPSSVVFVPGNHDCNFKDLGDLRPKLLDQIHNQLETIAVDGETVERILEVQNNFFSFQESITGEAVPVKERLFYRRVFKVANQSIEFRCFNSAWLSSKHEEVGSLGMPNVTIESARAKTDSDLVISLVHHPHNWLSPGSYQAFRSAVQESSDFLFTGHEHRQGGQNVLTFAGDYLIHVENGPFQTPYSGESQFGIAHLDLAMHRWTSEGFEWQEGAFVKYRSVRDQVIASKSGRSASLQMTDSFLKEIKDPGTGFLHPRKQPLALADIYIFPDLKTRSISRRLQSPDDLPQEIGSSETPNRILSTGRLVIAGPSDCGKTALAKATFVEANANRGLSSLLLQGKNIKGREPISAFRSAADKAVEVTYGKSAIGRYAQLNVKERVLFVDDWDEIPFNKQGRLAILEDACAHYGCVILFVDDIFLIDELSGAGAIKPLDGFQVADIKEFGFRLRGQLVTKWHSLGTTYIDDEQTHARKVADSTRVIDTVLGRNLLPAYPVNVLSLLQSYDASAGSQNGGLGSYGQVYEALITARLAKVSIQSIDIGTKFTFLSRVAWDLFEGGKECISETEWRNIGQKYFEEYAIRVDSDTLLQSFISAGMITPDGCGYRFLYGYTYCYFVAKYFQENLADLDEGSAKRTLFEALKKLSESVYKQDNASIIIFYVFLTKDRALIHHVIANAGQIFNELDEFDFNKQLDFVNRIIKPARTLALPCTPPAANRQEFDRRRDEAGERLEPDADPRLTNVIYSPSLPIEQKLVIAIRYLTLMGQILRNFPGSLKADTKLELAFESYALGLRILTAVFGIARNDAEILTAEVSVILRSKMAFTGTEKELRDRAELIVAELLREITFGILKRISHAIGLKELEATYEDVAKLRDNNLPSRLIQLSIRLDHFEKFPKQDIKDMTEELRGNVFTYQTLRDLVINHVHLFPVPQGVKQWAGQLLSFSVNTAPVLGSARKKLKR